MKAQTTKMKKAIRPVMIITGLAMLLMATLSACIPGPEPGKTPATIAGKKAEIVSVNETVQFGMRTVHVEVKNVCNELIDAISLRSVYKDSSGKIVGTGYGSGLNIPAGEVRVVDVLASDVQNAATYQVEIAAIL